MPRLVLFLTAILAFCSAIPASFAQTLQAKLPPTRYEVALKAPLFRSAHDTAKGPEVFLPVGSSTSVVGLWNPRWVVVAYNGYLYMTPAARLKNFDPAALPKPTAAAAEPEAPRLPIDSETKLVTYEGVVEVPGATKDQLYDRALDWMAKTYQSANDVVQIKDKDQGKLLAKGGILFIYRNVPTGFVVHTQTIYVRDGRYKYVMTGFHHQNLTGGVAGRDGSMGALEQTAPPKGFRPALWYDMLRGTDAKVKTMISDLEQAMQARGKDPSKF